MDQSSRHEQPVVRVVYIAGSMRSGSTLVAEMLGSYDGALAVGELNNVSFAAIRGQRCSCGREPIACDVWRHVFKELLNGTAPATLWALRRHLERQRRLPQLSRWARRPESVWPAEIVHYVGFLRSTVRLLLDASGASTLIDSSKSPAGLGLMKLAFPGEVAMLHLLRDPRGVAHSESHHVHPEDTSTSAPPSVRSIVQSATGWDSVNLECYLMSRSIETRTRAWYEWLCDAPRERLSVIARQLGLVGRGPLFEEGRVQLEASHVLAGNPSRTEPSWRTLQPDETWREGLTLRERRLVSAVVWPLEPAFRLDTRRRRVTSSAIGSR
jgi:hypothetical protein